MSCPGCEPWPLETEGWAQTSALCESPTGKSIQRKREDLQGEVTFPKGVQGLQSES